MKGRNNETRKSGCSPYRKYKKVKHRYSKEYNEWLHSVKGKKLSTEER